VEIERRKGEEKGEVERANMPVQTKEPHSHSSGGQDSHSSQSGVAGPEAASEVHTAHPIVRIPFRRDLDRVPVLPQHSR
jgi:hypothetical protein